MPSGFPSGLRLTPTDWSSGPNGGPGDEDSFLPRGGLGVGFLGLVYTQARTYGQRRKWARNGPSA